MNIQTIIIYAVGMLIGIVFPYLLYQFVMNSLNKAYLQEVQITGKPKREIAASTKWIYIFVLGLWSLGCYYPWRTFLQGENDKVEIENPKLAVIFQKEIDKKIVQYNQINSPGLIATAEERVANLFNTIKRVETSVEFSVNSMHPFNTKYMKITYNDGSIIDNIYLGGSKQRGMFPYPNPYPQLLVNFEFNDGKLIKALTNGVERKISPNDLRLEYIVKEAIYVDIDKNPELYYKPTPKGPTEKEIEEDWKK